jgi:hypothetical protein
MKYQLKRITIDNGIINAYDQNGNRIKLSRSQRNAVTKYNVPNFEELVQKEWQNKNVIHDEFTITKDGELVYIH